VREGFKSDQVSQTQVSVTVKMPEDKRTETEEEDLKQAFKDHTPEFSAELATGHDFEEMYDSKDKNVVAVVDSIKFSTHFAVASTIMEIVKEMHPPKEVHLLEYLSQVALTEEILYKPGLKTSQGVPDFSDAITGMARNMKQNAQEEDLSAIKKISAASDGMEKMEVRGLPYKWEIDATFTHIKPFHLLEKMCE